ncbi:MAG: hypothetical protein IPH06_07490 [Alphaproteobacteria bacterium]|nr:hypothetical protein [Alphaproteobacteria bacterium]QQS57853.1 MAG: hypothetical protein IPN28_03250 [Alphaproteobacteria bacterium]
MPYKFEIGERVIVSSEGGWKNNCPGVITGGPEWVITLEGNEDYFWVTFDTPQEDINDDHKYAKAQILSRYISKTTQK